MAGPSVGRDAVNVVRDVFGVPSDRRPSLHLTGSPPKLAVLQVVVVRTEATVVVVPSCSTNLPPAGPDFLVLVLAPLIVPAPAGPAPATGGTVIAERRRRR